MDRLTNTQRRELLDCFQAELLAERRRLERHEALQLDITAQFRLQGTPASHFRMASALLAVQFGVTIEETTALILQRGIEATLADAGELLAPPSGACPDCGEPSRPGYAVSHLN